jgi:hypothetical protein
MASDERGYADGTRLGDGGSAGIRRRKRNEGDRGVGRLALQDDENRNRMEAADDRTLREEGRRGDVPNDLVEVVVVEERELPGGIGGAGIRQRCQREDERDEKKDQPAQGAPILHWLS